MRVLLRTIGYWEQSSSFASCIGVTRKPPLPGEYATPLNMLDDIIPLRPFFSCPVTEFRFCLHNNPIFGLHQQDTLH